MYCGGDFDTAVQMNLQQLLANPYFQLSGWLIGAVGLIVSVFGVKRKRLSYMTSANEIVKPSHRVSGLKVLYRGEEVPQVTACVVTIWSRGWAVVHGSDMAPAAPILIGLPNGAKVLECKIQRQTSPGNNCRVTQNATATQCVVEFDYLAHRDRCEILVLHTGGASERVFVGGEVMGGGKITRRDYAGSRGVAYVIVGVAFGAYFMIKGLVGSHGAGIPEETLIQAGTILAAFAGIALLENSKTWIVDLLASNYLSGRRSTTERAAGGQASP